MTDALDELARCYGVHEVAALSSRPCAVETIDLMRRLRRGPAKVSAGRFPPRSPISATRWILTGGDDNMLVRVAVRPSGTEPKLKCYLEIPLRGW